MRLIIVIFLILNGSFDSTISNPFFDTKYWEPPSNSSPDLFHFNYPSSQYRIPINIMGFQNSNSDLGYYGIVQFQKSNINAREYIQGQLKNRLNQDSTYCFEIYMSLADSMSYAIKNRLGVYFSNTKVDSPQVVQTLLHFNPPIEFIDSVHFTDKVNWVKYSASYKAQGGESFIVIGNFRPDSLLDTLRIGGGSQQWMESTYYYLDDVWLSHCDSVPDSLVNIKEQNLNFGLSVYPNPILQNEFTVKSKKNAKLNFVLYNSLGQQIPIEASPNRDGYAIKPQSNFKSGLYWLRVSDGVREETVKLIKR